MNKVFPQMHTVSLSTAAAGSIIRIPRSNMLAWALVTDQSSDDGGRSLVILNASVPDRPSTLFVDNWRDQESCLGYRTTLHFELSTDDTAIDIKGRQWGNSAGVIVSIENRFYIQAAPTDDFQDRYRHVDIESGSLFSGQVPNDVWTFCAWRLWLRDPIPERSVMLFEFDVRKKQA